MLEQISVPLSVLVQEFDLEVVYRSGNFPSIRVTTEDVSRPGLPLAGYFEYFDAERLQVLGKVEISYLARMEPDEREAIFDRLLSYHFPALIIARGLNPGEDCLAHGPSAMTSPSCAARKPRPILSPVSCLT